VEAVPFRLTPNLQDFMTPSVIEGVLSSAIHSIAEVYYKPESELCEFLPLIVRDELISWMLLSQTSRSRFVLDSESKPISFNHDMDILDQAGIDERQFLGRVVQNCELIMKRCQTLACVKESEKVNITLPYFI
jgi:phosphatidylinositol kinase/protein kinase (PI-3  family)